jgi:anaerobic selenocysteine-containing dehydrogenase
MKPTRRDLLTLGGGALAGALFTPVPWKVLDDVSIWTQNWPWIPQPPRGPVETKNSVCTLCSKSCGIKVRLAAGCPVGVAGAASHPITRGALCPLAFGAHQLNWHPRRLRRVLHRGSRKDWNTALSAFRKACSEGKVAFIDGRPGRAASGIYEQLAVRLGGGYFVARTPEDQALAAYERWTGVPGRALGYDLENARTIVSFGAPLLDGWLSPGRFSKLWAERAAGQADPELRLIQIEPSLSRTGSCAWRWIPIHPGSEAALAAGLTNVLVTERLVEANGPVPEMTRAEAASRAGFGPAALLDLARTIAERRPALAIANNGEPAIAALNVILGSVGTRGGIVLRQQDAKPLTPVEDMPGSFRAVLIDSTAPWNVKVPGGAEVFRFAAWHGEDSKADWLLPAPGFLEELTDVPTAAGSPVETYAIAAQLAVRPEGVRSAAEFLATSHPETGTIESGIEERCKAIFTAGRGTVCGTERVPLASFESAAKFQEALTAGAVWIGEPPSSTSLRCALTQWPHGQPQDASLDWTEAWTQPVLPPLASKLYIESRLRERPSRRTV